MTSTRNAARKAQLEPEFVVELRDDEDFGDEGGFLLDFRFPTIEKIVVNRWNTPRPSFSWYVNQFQGCCAFGHLYQFNICGYSQNSGEYFGDTWKAFKKEIVDKYGDLFYKLIHDELDHCTVYWDDIGDASVITMALARPNKSVGDFNEWLINEFTPKALNLKFREVAIGKSHHDGHYPVTLYAAVNGDGKYARA